MPGNVWTLIGVVAVMVLVFGAITALSQSYTLDGIKAKTVGDGQHGTARWATPHEMRETFRSVLFRPEDWRRNVNRPETQGLILGSISKRKLAGIKELLNRQGRWDVTALVDSDDIHCLMIGASGIGKTAYFLYPSAPVRAV